MAASKVNAIHIWRGDEPGDDTWFVFMPFAEDASADFETLREARLWAYTQAITMGGHVKVIETDGRS